MTDTETTGPARAPLVCGALGRYDRDRVSQMAAAFPTELRPVHEDEGSILMLDREPLRWNGARERGLGWIEGDLWRPGAAVVDWRQAARHGACGLVVDGGRYFLHSAANGFASIYWTDERRATYFASRIDPLVTSSARPFSIDWDAWAAIIALRYPLGERTPFTEISRLGPSSTLRRRLGGGRARAHRWRWLELEPCLSMAEGAEAAAIALREMLSSL